MFFYQVACQTGTPRYRLEIALGHENADARLRQSAHAFDISSQGGGRGGLKGFRTFFDILVRLFVVWES